MKNQSQKKKGIIKKLAIYSLIVFSALFFGIVALFFSTTIGLRLNANALGKNQSHVVFYDSKNNEITLSSAQGYVPIEDINQQTISGFIAMEDKKFYSHNGLDFRRIIGAMVHNIKNRNVSEGGSTISQQLIKNTQLSQEKTLTRKLKEIKLTRDLEKAYSKNEIMEFYLNSIYFGNGCYGIKDASQFYFGKEPKYLDANENAFLVAVINAPSIYNPISHPDKAQNRKDLVLSVMKKDGVISTSEYEKFYNAPLNFKFTKSKDTYSLCALDEACSILHLTESELLSQNLKIYTYKNNEISISASRAISEVQKNISDDVVISNIVADNNLGAVVSYVSSSSGCIQNEKHQPGSLIKPLLVYGPAIENGILYPCSQILDEPVDYDGFSPSNADKTYHGYVSVRQAINKSLNIPAVKVLDMVGIEKAKSFANKLGLAFDAEDNNLALALGGLTTGFIDAELASGYMALAGGGKYTKLAFIRRIENDSGNIIYEHNPAKVQVIKDSTAYLLTDMLKDVSKNGTASRLSGFGFDIASKTGTVGLTTSNENKEAFSVSYTTENLFLTHISANRTMSASVNGATYPTIINGQLIADVYDNHVPENFAQPSSVETRYVDAIELNDNHRVVLASDDMADRYKIGEIFAVDGLPLADIPHSVLTISGAMYAGSAPQISIKSKSTSTYEIFRNDELVWQEEGTGSTLVFEDVLCPKNSVNSYYAIETTYRKNEVVSNTIKIYYPT
ncbi:MAG: transglycosylase domain-containing protein [Clostridia bacterium]|nr:transglycosylase domain-containing protein [Clostridia bacterium]